MGRTLVTVAILKIPIRGRDKDFNAFVGLGMDYDDIGNCMGGIDNIFGGWFIVGRRFGVAEGVYVGLLGYHKAGENQQT